MKGEIHRMKESLNSMVISLSIVSVVAIVSIMICCLAALGFNSKVTLEKEKIEVDSTSNFNYIN